MIYLIAFGVFALFFGMMALGLVIKNKPLKGSCGGVAKLMGNENCEICGGDPNKCEETADTKEINKDLFKEVK